ncbi:MAG: hypothetical protein JWM09_701 [Francisellaceae bacterium]|nr:hypothetical protein [Francisellaceae bacterium]
MNLNQFNKGFAYFTCPLLNAFSLNPVRLAKHPIILQQLIIYDRKLIVEWLNLKGTCPNTGHFITPDKRKLINVRLEMLMFILAALKSYAKEEFSLEEGDSRITELKIFLEKMENGLPLNQIEGVATTTIIISAENYLHNLANDEWVNYKDLPLKSIGNLMTFGIQADYAKQDAFANTTQTSSLCQFRLPQTTIRSAIYRHLYIAQRNYQEPKEQKKEEIKEAFLSTL